MRKKAYLFEAKGIQRYISAGDRLKDIAGGSELLAAVTNSNKVDLLKVAFDACGWQPSLPPQDDGVFLSRRAGGVFMLHFNECEETEVQYFEALWTLLFQQWAPGLEYTATVAEGDSEQESLDNAYTKSAAGNVRNNALTELLPLAGPLIGTAQRTGLPAVKTEGEERVDQPSMRKLNVVEKGRYAYANKFLPSNVPNGLKKDDFVWPTEMDGDDPEQAKKKKRHPEKFFPFKGRNQIGLIHADVSNLGALYVKFGEVVRGDLSRRLKLSDEIENALRRAVQTATEQVLVPNAQKERNKYVLPARPILLGGDDVTVLVRADLALDYTQILLERIEEETRSALQNFDEAKQAGFDVLTACAGVAFAGASMPFYLLSGLAESLCSYAKKIVKSCHDGTSDKPVPSAIAFHRVTAALIAESFKDILSEQETDKNDRILTAQPYLVGQEKVNGLLKLEDLAGLRTALGQDGVGAGSLHEIRKLLFDNTALAEEIYQRWRKATERRAQALLGKFDGILKDEIGISNPERRIPFIQRNVPGEGARFVTPLFDALEWKALS